jgi:hypothetical protein
MHDESVGPYVGAGLVSFRFEKLVQLLANSTWIHKSHCRAGAYERTKCEAFRPHFDAIATKIG